MDESAFVKLAEQTLKQLATALDRLDPDDVEVDAGGGYLTLVFRDGARCVINSQRPAREIWLAGDETAWHFSLQPDGRWVATKTGEELRTTLAAMVARHVQQVLTF